MIGCMRTSSRSFARAVASLALVLLAACGDDSTDGSSGAGGADAKCEPLTLFTIADVSPAKDERVDGDAVVHSFRIVKAQGLVQQLNFETTDQHTAGAPTPGELDFTVQQDGADLVYTATPVSWATPGHVELSVRDTYEVEGCRYGFPSPLYAYDVEAQPTGAGGAGGGG